MITEYFRPETLPEAIELVKKSDTFPLGGGTLLSQSKSASIKVVDLQALGLNKLQKKGKTLEIGATVTLQQLLEIQYIPEPLHAALKLEAPLNIRNSATVAGTLTAADGRSSFASALLAMDAKLTIQPGDESVQIGDILPLRGMEMGGKIITAITIPLNAKLSFESVARTPGDKSIVCAALASWPSGRARLALGGYGASPLLAMDGTESEGLEEAARNAFHEANDEWASAEFRIDVAATLAKRCQESIK